MLIHPFDGSRRDAEGLLAVEKETFAESPCNVDEVIHLLTSGEQRAWLALEDGEVAGFVMAFPTYTLHGRRWEVDLIAVQPASRGRGIATELIKAAVEGAGGHSLDIARAAVATGNPVSQQAFTKAGFTPDETARNLLLYEIQGYVSRPLDSGPVTVRDLARSTEEAGAMLRLDAGLMLRPDDVLALASREANEILVAVHEGEIVGLAELLYVETLLYRGIWLESVTAKGADRETQAALVSEAVERAKRKRLDEIGCLVNVEDRLLREVLVGQGFSIVNEYHIFRRDL